MRKLLFRRREIVLPTLWGWLCLLGACLAIGVSARHWLFDFLACTDPAPAASVLVVEGWLPESELDQALDFIRQGHYQQIVTSGGPIDPRWRRSTGYSSYAELAAAYLAMHPLQGVTITAVSAPATAQDRTYVSAVAVRDWLPSQGLRPTALDVYTVGAHARRSRMVYRTAFDPEVRIGVVAARTSEFDQAYWWRTSSGAKTVMGEWISVAWTACCFHPGR